MDETKFIKTNILFEDGDIDHVINQLQELKQVYQSIQYSKGRLTGWRNKSPEELKADAAREKRLRESAEKLQKLQVADLKEYASDLGFDIVPKKETSSEQNI